MIKQPNPKIQNWWTWAGQIRVSTIQGSEKSWISTHCTMLNRILGTNRRYATHASVGKLASLCDSVSHVSVWAAAVLLFPFPGRLGIIQGKAGRQTQGGEAAKNLTYYREVRLLLFAVTFRLSGLGDFFFFFFTLFPPPFPSVDCMPTLKIYFLQSRFCWNHKIWLFIFFYPYERFSLFLFLLSPSLSLSLSQTSCAVPRSPGAATLTSQRNASQEVVLSALCARVWTAKRTCA